MKVGGEKGWKTSAKVIGKCKEPQCYIVETDNGAVTERSTCGVFTTPVIITQDCSGDILRSGFFSGTETLEHLTTLTFTLFSVSY